MCGLRNCKLVLARIAFQSPRIRKAAPSSATAITPVQNVLLGGDVGRELIQLFELVMKIDHFVDCDFA